LVIGYASQVFTAAVEEGIIVRNPLAARSIQKPAPVRAEAVPWTEAEIEAVADHLPARYAAMSYLGAAVGLRQGELFGAAVDDVDFLRRTMHVEVQVKFVGGCLVFAPVKNKKTRDLPVAGQVIPVLAEHVRLHPPVEVTLPWREPDGRPVKRALLFTRPDGRPLEREAFNRPWRAAWAKAGIPDRGRLNGCHVLRHTAASAWLSADLNPAKVAAYLGDTFEVVLSTCAHFLPDNDGRPRESMETFFAPLTAPADASRARDVPAESR
jgi:integrase